MRLRSIVGLVLISCSVGLHAADEPSATTPVTIGPVAETVRRDPNQFVLLRQPDDEGGFCDVLLGVSEAKISDGRLTLTLRAADGGSATGLALELPVHVEAGLVDDKANPNAFARGALVLRSVGAASDRFVVALGAGYGVRLKASAMTPSLTCSVWPLEDHATDASSHVVHLKAFIGDSPTDDASRYAEFFVNVDLPHGVVSLREKDPEYRRPLLKALGALLDDP